MRDRKLQFVASLALRLAVFILACRNIALQAQIVTEDATRVFIANPALEFGFQKWDGRLMSLRNPATGTQFMGCASNAWWSPFYLKYQSNGIVQEVGGWVADTFDYSAQTNAGAATLKLRWTGFHNGGVDLDMGVVINVTLYSNSPLSHWSMVMTNDASAPIEEIAFPFINGVGQISASPEDDYLAYPSLSGMLFKNPLQNFWEWGWGQSYPSFYSTMQFMAYYGSNPAEGVYLASADTAANSKSPSLSRPDTNWFSFSILNRPEIVGGPGVVVSLNATVGLFAGDWYDAALIYRNWALQQPWTAQGSLRSRADIPAWLKQVGLRQWMYTHTSDSDHNHFSIIPDVSSDSAATLGYPIMASWIGWERQGWYLAYPDVYPPKEGWDSFGQTIRSTQSASNFVSFIPCATSYSALARDWDSAQSSACQDQYGNLQEPFLYSEYSSPLGSNVIAPLYKMCPATPFWQDKLRALLTPLTTNGADLIYLDGFPVFGPQSCQATNHSHPKGGGHWWFDAYRDLFQDIKSAARAANPRLAFGSEGMAETCLPFLDLQWDPTTTGWSPSSMESIYADISQVQLIPLWHAVYHDYGLLESGIAFHNKDAPSGAVGYGDYRDYYVRGFALALVWGEMPCTWYADEKMSQVDEPGEQEMVAFMRRIVQARQNYANDYLVYGRMLRPPAIAVPTFRIAGADPIPYGGPYYPPFDEKTVLGSAWKAPSDKIGYLFCNISPNPQSFRLSIAPKDVELPVSAVCSITENRNGISTNRDSLVCLPITLLVEVNPLDVLLVEVAPQAPSLSCVISDGVPSLTAPGGYYGATWTLEQAAQLPDGPWVEVAALSSSRPVFTDSQAASHQTLFYRLRLSQ